MKISAKQYAIALYEVVNNKKTSEVKSVIKGFIETVASNNDFSKTDKIINEFAAIWNREQGIVEAEVVSARALDKPTVKWLQDYIASLSRARAVAMDEIVDKSLLGGVVVKYGDKILDGSLKTKLNELKRTMAK